MKYKAYAATMQSVWFSEDEGQSWARILTPTGGFYNEARCWSVLTHPERANHVVDDLALVGRNVAQQIRRQQQLRERGQIPLLRRNAHFIVFGTRPGDIFISEDNGENWTRSNLDAATECWFINTTRVTSIHFDPMDRDTIWITIEIDGVIRSRDRGKTWEQLICGLHDNDTHDLVFLDVSGNRTILCSTEDGVHRSTDNGANWEQLKIPQAKWDYFRSLKQPVENSPVVIASVGDKPSGEAGQFLISRDFGDSWAEAKLSHPPNSTLWSIGTNAADTLLLFAATIFGQIFKSTDGGESWYKIQRELGEIRMITWAPI